MANLVSFVILIALLYGRSLHRVSRTRHVRWMVAVIVADVSLILYLVLARDALSRIEPGMSAALMVHVFFALSTVVGYGLIAWAGWRQLRGENARPQLRRLDQIVVPLRILTLFTSLLLQFLNRG